MNETVLTVTLNPSLDKTIVLDQLRTGSLNRAQEVRLDPGGKGINVAKLLHDFQIPVVAAGLAGGAEGRELEQLLRQAGLATAFMPAEGRTRTNLKIIDDSCKVTTEINEPGAEVSEASLNMFMNELHGKLEDVSHLVLGGSLPPGVPADVYAELIRLARANGIVTVLDADGEAFRHGLAAQPYALKPNIHELEQWTGKELRNEEDIVAAGRELIAGGVSVLLISMGEHGSIALNGKEAYRVRPFPIDVKSTVGAGDSMVAALIYCLRRGMALAEIAAFTSAAGTLTASKEGTQVCSLNEVLEHVHLVSVQPM